jgi:HEPN domain-containing protein
MVYNKVKLMGKNLNLERGVINWIKSSDYDIKTAEHMFRAGRYIYVLFMCHLSVEKLLKALYEGVLKKVPPKTHNLIYLSSAVDLEIPENHLRLLESLNDLSIVTRYPEDIDHLIKSFKRQRVEEYLKRTKEFLKWLKRDMRLRR